MDHQKAEIAVIELPRFTVIELPCFVSSQETAFKMIGNEQLIAHQIYQHQLLADQGGRSNANLQLKFPSNDPFRHNLLSSFHKVNGLIVRITRKVRKNKLTGCVLHQENFKCSSKTEVLGRIDYSYRFDIPADYHFLPTSLDDAQYLNQDSRGRNRNAILETIPHSFCRNPFNTKANIQKHLSFNQNLPNKFQWLKLRGKPVNSNNKISNDHNEKMEISDELDDDNIIGDENDADPTSDMNIRKDVKSSLSAISAKLNPEVDFDVRGRPRHINSSVTGIHDAIPTGHPAGVAPIKWLIGRERQSGGLDILANMREVFQDLPLLTKKLIYPILKWGNNSRSDNIIKECLPYICYYSNGGPWMNMWIRYSFNPFQQPETRFHQILNVRFSDLFLKEISKKIVAHLGLDDQPTHLNSVVNLDTLTIDSMTTLDADVGHEKLFDTKIPISIFGYVIKKQIIIQLFQLADPILFERVRLEKPLLVCEPQGWYPIEFLDTLRTLVMQTVANRVSMILSIPKQQLLTNIGKSIQKNYNIE
eukprot:gene16236-22097_t